MARNNAFKLSMPDEDPKDIVGSPIEDYGWTVRVVTLTPRLAKQWYDKLHPDQRKYRKGHLDGIIRDLKAGRWKLNGEPIVFDRNGRIVNGQHRLLAVIETGVTILVHVLWGVDPSVYCSYDIVSKRTSADALKTRGVVNSHVAAAAIRSILIYAEHPDFAINEVYSPEAVSEFEQAHPELTESVSVGVRFGNLRSSITSSNATCAHFLFAKIDRKAADSFFGHLIEGVGLEKYSPIRILRDRALDRGWRPVAREQFAFMFKAWQAWREGREMKLIRWNIGDAFPVLTKN